MSAASAIALFVDIKRYEAGINTSSGINLNADSQWWWDMALTPIALWAIGALAFTDAFLSDVHISHTPRFHWLSLCLEFALANIESRNLIGERSTVCPSRRH